MRVSAVSMSKHFGMLGKMYGEHRFALAPNEQKAFKGFLDQAFVKVFKSYVWDQWIYYVPQTIGAYLLYDWAKKRNYEVGRKNPADYANDK
ncbi:UcrQ family protein [Ancylostoma duodenale]|uniref:Cytochrome b-c1 complex subunit 8 n=1 Tax=Ancylostoma duodenale TaxID=51022 RepID=A0A0C2FMG7_9BILA|nr:UcrQ family protein [Ancylostoma duodenale]